MLNAKKIPMWVWTIPYVPGGRTRDGADCWGLIVILYEEFLSINLPEFGNLAYYPGSKVSNTSEQVFTEFNKEEVFTKVYSPKYGDVVLIDMMGFPVHIGFCLDDKHMIHLSRASGVTIENFTEGKWNRKISGFYRKV